MRRPRAATAPGRGWAVVLTILLTPALLLGAWAVVTLVPDPTASGRPAEAVLAPVGTASRTASAEVALEAVPAAGQEVLVQAAGTVTDPPREGAVWDDGDVALAVDDRPVRAMVSDKPLWRSLSTGDRGADVERLQRYLVETGYRTGDPDGTYGSATAEQVRQFNEDATGAARDRSFDPATVVWVGPEPLEVADVVVATGQSVSPGTPVATGPSRTASVTVTEPDGLGDTYADGAEVAVEDVVVPYVAGTGTIDAPQDVAAVAAALGADGAGSGRLRSATEASVRVVPASALVTGTDGSTCVYPDADAEPVPVVSVGGGSSSVQIEAAPEVEALTEVLANPGTVGVSIPCGSS